MISKKGFVWNTQTKKWDKEPDRRKISEAPKLWQTDLLTLPVLPEKLYLERFGSYRMDARVITDIRPANAQEKKDYPPSCNLVTTSGEIKIDEEILKIAVKTLEKQQADGLITLGEAGSSQRYESDITEIKKEILEEALNTINQKIIEKNTKMKNKYDEIMQKREKAMQEAKEKNKDVYVRKIGTFDADEYGHEEGIVTAVEVACPDGKFRVADSASY